MPRQADLLDAVDRAVEAATRLGADVADARSARVWSSSLLVQDERVERLSVGATEGVGVRALVDGAWGFASSDALRAGEIDAVARDAVRLAQAAARLPRRRAELAEGGAVTGEFHEEPEIPPAEVPVAEKTERLLALERAGRSAGNGSVVNSVVQYTDQSGEIALAASRGARVRRRTGRVLMSTLMVARDEHSSQRWVERVGRVGGYECVRAIEPGTFSVRAAERASALLRAPHAPAGAYPVVLDPSVAGLLAHECLGHNAEADLVLSGQSMLEGRLGERVASEAVTVVDDPTLPRAFGSYPFDAEGVAPRRVEIIGRGVLRSYLHSLETARRMNQVPDGHGRAESYSARPLARMSNTFFAAGEAEVEEMIRGVEKGLLLEHGTSGYVLSERGNYTCRAACGRLIEKGELGEMVRDVSFSGLVLETLRDIDAVSREWRLDSPGFCEKDGQGVPVDSGGPFVRVTRVVVGGR